MLGYIVFCCFFLAQVKGQCHTNELSGKVKGLSKNNRCTHGEIENLRFLPTTWPPCKWPCLQKGFEDLNNAKNILDRQCTTEINNIYYRIEQIKLKDDCQYVVSNATCENTTTGNIGEFLTEAKNYLQSLARKKTRNQC